MKILLFVLFILGLAVGAWAEYTPPALDEVDFELTEYTPPALDEVDFEMDEQEATTSKKMMGKEMDGMIKGMMGE